LSDGSIELSQHPVSTRGPVLIGIAEPKQRLDKMRPAWSAAFSSCADSAVSLIRNAPTAAEEPISPYNDSFDRSSRGLASRALEFDLTRPQSE
jgi:hypothetical protein